MNISRSVLDILDVRHNVCFAILFLRCWSRHRVTFRWQVDARIDRKPDPLCPGIGSTDWSLGPLVRTSGDLPGGRALGVHVTCSCSGPEGTIDPLVIDADRADVRILMVSIIPISLIGIIMIFNGAFVSLGRVRAPVVRPGGSVVDRYPPIFFRVSLARGASRSERLGARQAPVVTVSVSTVACLKPPGRVTIDRGSGARMRP